MIGLGKMGERRRDKKREKKWSKVLHLDFFLTKAELCSERVYLLFFSLLMIVIINGAYIMYYHQH